MSAPALLRMPLLRMRGIVKEFPGVRTLDGVDLDVAPGQVHCLLGQNGAGKSTLIKVLAGAHRPDGGEISWAGEPVAFPSPQAANAAGIATIHQELDLVPGLSVAENVVLGHEPSRLGFSRPRDAERVAAALGGRAGPAGGAEPGDGRPGGEGGPDLDHAGLGHHHPRQRRRLPATGVRIVTAADAFSPAEARS